MDVDVKPGKYVIAVSGGVDSVVLLHLLAHDSKLKTQSAFIVAHFDHGIRQNSINDRKFVEDLAKKYQLPFEYKREELGPDASEALAREHRYIFLNKVKDKHGAESIITAHHHNDVIETACINIIRGTFRKGLTSLKSGEIIRPLLSRTKSEILDYAKLHNLDWHEDESNSDEKYLRNLIRSKLASAPVAAKQKLDKIIKRSLELNQEMDEAVEEIYAYGYSKDRKDYNRGYFIGLPYSVSCEILAFWLRKERVEFDRKNVELLVMNLKTGKPGAKFDAGGGKVFAIADKQISLEAV